MAKQIIKDQQIVEDSFTTIGADDALPKGDVILPYSRWQEQQAELASHNGKVGVLLNGNDYDIYAIGEELAKQEVIALDFPAFVDGRSYSFARLLRERFGFKGELRAVGNVLRDQMFYMHRCGFNAYDIEDGHSLETALTAFKDFSVSYQPIPEQA